MKFRKVFIGEVFGYEEAEENGFSGIFRRIEPFLVGGMEVNAVDIDNNTRFIFIGANVDVDVA